MMDPVPDERRKWRSVPLKVGGRALSASQIARPVGFGAVKAKSGPVGSGWGQPGRRGVQAERADRTILDRAGGSPSSGDQTAARCSNPRTGISYRRLIGTRRKVVQRALHRQVAVMEAFITVAAALFLSNPAAAIRRSLRYTIKAPGKTVRSETSVQVIERQPLMAPGRAAPGQAATPARLP